MELSRRNVLVTFTVLGLASSILIGFSYLGIYIYDAVYKFIMSQEASELRWLSWLFESPWTDTLVQYALLMGIAYIPVYLLLCWLPKDRTPLMKLSGEDLVVSFTASLGVGYLLNFAGTFINAYVSQFTGKSWMDMNPVVEMTSEMTPSMFLYMCIVGSVMEEVMFRGLLLKRARLFGDWTAAVYTALMFGLMHGNIAQFLYATGVGVILGYIAVKTNSIRYTIPLHIALNGFSAFSTVGEMLVYDVGGEMLSVFYLFGMLATVVFFIVCGMAVLAKYGRFWIMQMKYHDGPPSEHKVFIYLNPGFAIYVLLCAIEFLKYLI